MVDTKFCTIEIIKTISGQVRHRRKLNKSLFFIDLQPSNEEPKCQIFFRSDDYSSDDMSVQDAYRACRPGQVIQIQVGLPTDPSESIGKSYNVWQSNCPVEIIVPYTSRDAFTQDRPLASIIEEQQQPVIKKSSLNCKYWINKNKCERGDQCLFQHPTGEAFEKARVEWVKERIEKRKLATHDPDDPHTSKKPHGLRAIIFADWIRKTFVTELQNGGSVLDIAGGKGEISMILSRGFGIPSTVIEPNQRKLPNYWYTRLRRLMYRFEQGDNTDLSQPDWKSKEIQIDLQSWPNNMTPHYMHTLLDDAFLKENKELVANTTVFIGLHSDQATIPIVDAALKAGKAFAVVPCCVFSHDNRSRQLKSGELVTTTEQQIQYICEKDTQGRGTIKTAYLDFEGKNIVVYWKPTYD